MISFLRERLQGIVAFSFLGIVALTFAFLGLPTFTQTFSKNNYASFILLNPITGRKHQLRKQLFNLGNSIIGDKKYNSTNNSKINNKNLMLHSYEIKFKINEKKYTFRATPPDYFRNMLKTKRLNF